MPYETYPISGTHRSENEHHDRGPHDVAKDISSEFEKIYARGGKFVTQLVENTGSVTRGNQIVNRGFIYLVAEFPDEPPSHLPSRPFK